MASLVESENYGAIHTTNRETIGFYVIIFKSEEYTLQDDTTKDRKIITSGGLFVKSQYLCSMQIDTNWYCNQQQKDYVITVPTRKILHPQLEVNAITDFNIITTSVNSGAQAEKPSQDSLYV